MLNRTYRLKKTYQFNFVYKKGETVPSKHLVLIFAPSRGVTKIGFSVSNKIGKAVVRNKVKRRMRAVAARLLPALPAGYSYVFAARQSISELSFLGIDEAMTFAASVATQKISQKQKRPQ